MGSVPVRMSTRSFGKRELWNGPAAPFRNWDLGGQAGHRSSVPQRMPFSQCPSPTVLWNKNLCGGSQGIPDIGVREDLRELGVKGSWSLVIRHSRMTNDQ